MGSGSPHGLLGRRRWPISISSVATAEASSFAIRATRLPRGGNAHWGNSAPRIRPGEFVHPPSRDEMFLTSSISPNFQLIGTIES